MKKLLLHVAKRTIQELHPPVHIVQGVYQLQTE